MFDIVFVMTGDVRYNSRALKQLRVLSEEGYKVMAIGLAKEENSYKLDERVSVKLFSRPQGNGPRFFLKCHRLFREQVAAYPAKVYHASDLYNLPALVHLARANEAKLVYDARERYPHVTSYPGPALGALVLECARIIRCEKSRYGFYCKFEHCVPHVCFLQHRFAGSPI